LAQALGVHVGDSITFNGRSIPVVGIAISAAIEVYPWSDAAQGPGASDYGGMVWLTTADARAATGDAPVVHLIYLKLSDPAATDGFGRSSAVDAITADSWVDFHYRQDVLNTDTNMIKDTRPTLIIGGWLLGVAAIVTLTALATVRATRDNRRAALLKAVGAGPGTVTAVLLAQHLLLTLLATALGLTAGTLAAPHLVDPRAGLLDTVRPPDTRTIAAAAVLAIVVAVTDGARPVPSTPWPTPLTCSHTTRT
jgi:putative ABC transport system permease protein